MHVDNYLLEIFLHNNTGLEYAGNPKNGVFRFQLTDKKKYRKWLSFMKRKYKREIKKYYPESILKKSKKGK